LKTILVTDGAGFVGNHACKALSRAGLRFKTYDEMNAWLLDKCAYAKGAMREIG
jgi:nucleoside-diphosphate-sugar epimerase